jgi:predicted house-cleaning noncanonical NTP pyrophosphatase (MazG superfamily)
MREYNKLVRDRIPEIIGAHGKAYETRILDDVEYQGALDEKLREELAEYEASGDLSELADLVEVVLAIVQHKGVTIEDFERIRLEKQKKRGGFKDKVLLVRAEE